MVEVCELRILRLVCVFGLASLVLGAGAGELDVAKAALRDGLWSVARAHAAKLPGDEPRLVVLESYANEGNWQEIGKLLAVWTNAVDGAFGYYRAAAAGDFAKAAKLLRATGSTLGVAESRMLEADLLVKAGETAAARKLWSEVVALTNVGERALTVAAANLGEPEPLRRAYETVRAPVLKRLAGLRYGMSLIPDAKTFAEGSRIIRAIVKDSPDSPGAQEAFVALAETDLAAVKHADPPPPKLGEATLLKISLSRFEIAAYNCEGRLLALFPCSIAKDKSKAPKGELRVVSLIARPNYTYTPDYVPAGKKKTRHIFPPGPNNPVGIAWIGLSLPGYGIHGTPKPESIGRPESHGCFRLANWNAARLYALCRIGTRVEISE